LEYLCIRTNSGDRIQYEHDAHCAHCCWSVTSLLRICGDCGCCLAEKGNASPELEFQTLSGSLFVKKLPIDGEADSAMMEMRFPSLPATDLTPPEFGSEACHVVECLVGGLPVTHVGWQAHVGYLLVVLDGASVNREQLEAIAPDMAALQASTGGNMAIRGAIVTCKGQASAGPQVLSRFFAPWAGIPEDPVTGSAHSILCPYWTQRLGVDTLTARQVCAHARHTPHGDWLSLCMVPA